MNLYALVCRNALGERLTLSVFMSPSLCVTEYVLERLKIRSQRSPTEKTIDFVN